MNMEIINYDIRQPWEDLTQVDPEYLIQNLNKFYGNDATTEFINENTVYEKERI